VGNRLFNPLTTRLIRCARFAARFQRAASSRSRCVIAPGVRIAQNVRHEVLCSIRVRLSDFALQRIQQQFAAPLIDVSGASVMGEMEEM